MIEYTLYEYVRNAYKITNSPFCRPLTEELIIHLVGEFGLDILKNSKLIAPTNHPSEYVLCCEV